MLRIGPLRAVDPFLVRSKEGQFWLFLPQFVGTMHGSDLNKSGSESDEAKI
jgi:hypothetical protein